jgi:hypothetical protein
MTGLAGLAAPKGCWTMNKLTAQKPRIDPDLFHAGFSLEWVGKGGEGEGAQEGDHRARTAPEVCLMGTNFALQSRFVCSIQATAHAILRTFRSRWRFVPVWSLS